MADRIVVDGFFELSATVHGELPPLRYEVLLTFHGPARVLLRVADEGSQPQTASPRRPRWDRREDRVFVVSVRHTRRDAGQEDE